jgi:hypothetical protein
MIWRIHRSRAVATAALLAGLVLAAPGCRDAAARRRVEALRGQVMAMHTAMVEGDRAAFLSVFHGPAGPRRYAGALFDCWQAGFAFADAYVDAYGSEAWQSLQGDVETRIRIPARNERWWSDVRIRPVGEDSAICRTPDGRHLFTARLGPEGWRFRASDLLGVRPEEWTDELLRGRLRAVEAMTLAIRRWTGKIGADREAFDAAWADARRETMARAVGVGDDPPDPS